MSIPTHEGALSTGSSTPQLVIRYVRDQDFWYVYGAREKVGIGRTLESALVQLAARLRVDGYEQAPLKELAPRLLPLMGLEDGR